MRWKLSILKAKDAGILLRKAKNAKIYVNSFTILEIYRKFFYSPRSFVKIPQIHSNLAENALKDFQNLQDFQVFCEQTESQINFHSGFCK